MAEAHGRSHNDHVWIYSAGFIIGQFVAYFNWTNIGVIIAVRGAEFLQNVGFTGFPLILGIIILSTIVNLFIGSGSAKWSILAPNICANVNVA